MSEFLPPYDSEVLPPYNMRVERIMFKIAKEFFNMHTTTTETDALTFVHDGIPDGGDLLIVVNLTRAERYNAEELARSEYGHNKIEVETQTFMGEDNVTLTIPYNVIRNFVLGQLRDAEIGALEQMTGEELRNYYVGVWGDNAPHGR